MCRLIVILVVQGKDCGRRQDGGHQPRDMARETINADATRLDEADANVVKILACGRGRRRDNSESGTDRAEGAMAQDENIDESSAQSKLQALIEIVRKQEEIEVLLSEEIGDLKLKHAEDNERVWQLLSR